MDKNDASFLFCRLVKLRSAEPSFSFSLHRPVGLDIIVGPLTLQRDPRSMFAVEKWRVPETKFRHTNKNDRKHPRTSTLKARLQRRQKGPTLQKKGVLSGCHKNVPHLNFVLLVFSFLPPF